MTFHIISKFIMIVKIFFKKVKKEPLNWKNFKKKKGML